MAEYKCPKCGTITNSKSFRFPFCRNCSEFLLKCRNCRHLIEATWECSHPRVSRGEFMQYSQTDDYKHIPDIDDIQACRYHRSKIIVQPTKPGAAGWGQRILRLGPVSVILLLVILVVALTAIGGQLRKSYLSRRASIEIRVSAPDNIMTGETMSIQIEVLNPRKDAGRENFTVRFPEKFFDLFQLVEVVPKPARMMVGTGMDGGRYLEYRDVDTSEAIQIELRCVPRRQGFRKYHFTLYTGSVLQSDHLLIVSVM